MKTLKFTVITLRSLSLNQGMTTFCFLAIQTELVGDQQVNSKHSIISLGEINQREKIS